MEEETKTLYEKAKEYYKSALQKTDFFSQRKELGNTMQFLIKAYHKREIDNLRGLPNDERDVFYFDKEETSELIAKLRDFFPEPKDFGLLTEEEEREIERNIPYSP